MNVRGALIDSLEETPRRFEAMLRQVPVEYLAWEPDTWDAIPGERYAALGQACHVRDIEIDGYHVRVRRMLEEENPDLVSLDSDTLAVERNYAADDLDGALQAFRQARAQTVRALRGLSDAQWQRRGTFAEYGELTLHGLINYLASHDQQHLACVQWLLGKINSR